MHDYQMVVAMVTR